MPRTLTGPRLNGKVVREWGRKAELVDRRREVWLLRCQGHSIRSISERLNTPRATVWNDLNIAESQWGLLADSKEVVQQQLLETHRHIVGVVLSTLEDQAARGQRTVQLDADGKVLGTTVRSGINPQVAAEASRCLVRIAQLMGIQDGTTADGSNAPGTTVTNIVLSSPSDGGSFEAWASAAASAPEPAAIEVSAAPAPGPSCASDQSTVD